MAPRALVMVTEAALQARWRLGKRSIVGIGDDDFVQVECAGAVGAAAREHVAHFGVVPRVAGAEMPRQRTRCSKRRPPRIPARWSPSAPSCAPRCSARRSPKATIPGLRPKPHFLEPRGRARQRQLAAVALAPRAHESPGATGIRTPISGRQEHVETHINISCNRGTIGLRQVGPGTSPSYRCP